MQLSFCANSTWQSAKRICALHAKLEEWVGWPRVNIRHESGKKLVLNVLYFHGVVHLARWQSEVLELCPAIWTNLWEVFNQQLIWHLVKEEGEENLALDAAREESKLSLIWKICQPKDCVLPAQPNQQKQQIRMGFCYDGEWWGPMRIWTPNLPAVTQVLAPYVQQQSRPTGSPPSHNLGSAWMWTESVPMLEWILTARW